LRFWEGLTNALNRKARQLAKWDCLGSVLSYFPIAFFAHNYTVSSLLPPLLYGYAGNCMPLLYWNRYDRLAASCTQNSKSIMSILSIVGSPISSTRKLHSNSPPLTEWRKFAIDDHWYYVNGEWTGIIINTISRLWVSWDKSINLKHPSYHISFCPNADTNNICHLVEAPTLRKAKKLAEQYYTAWSNVNHISDKEVNYNDKG
jgi:hypothetical protein